MYLCSFQSHPTSFPVCLSMVWRRSLAASSLESLWFHIFSSSIIFTAAPLQGGWIANSHILYSIWVLLCHCMARGNIEIHSPPVATLSINSPLLLYILWLSSFSCIPWTLCCFLLIIPPLSVSSPSFILDLPISPPEKAEKGDGKLLVKTLWCSGLLL